MGRSMRRHGKLLGAAALVAGVPLAAVPLAAATTELRSSIWAGNGITLFPGERQTLTVHYHFADLRGHTPLISMSGWNVARIDIAAPVS
jgi:hypothetical protein